MFFWCSYNNCTDSFTRFKDEMSNIVIEWLKLSIYNKFNKKTTQESDIPRSDNNTLFSMHNSPLTQDTSLDRTRKSHFK